MSLLTYLQCNRWGFDDVEFAHRLIVAGGVAVVLGEGLLHYHQEPAGRYNEWKPGATIIKDKMGGDNPRLNKKANPNWARICALIPGYTEYKKLYYENLAGDKVDV